MKAKKRDNYNLLINYVNFCFYLYTFGNWRVINDMTEQLLNTDNSLYSEILVKKIVSKKSEIAVIGSGYVGLTLAVQLAQSHFPVWSIDNNPIKIERLKSGISYIDDVDSMDIKKLTDSGKLIPTTEKSILSECDIIIICVPTPLTKNREPDLASIISVSKEMASMLRRGQLLILESTTYPGTINEVILPELEKSGLKVGSDFFLASSPERVDFGNEKHNRMNVPKVVGGVTSNCSIVANMFYEKIVPTVPVSSAEVAEMVKVYENTYRAVNIALVNEMAMLCDRMNLNIWEILDAAFSKPFGIQPFYPGPGIGGHCIPIDPFYLSWKAREFDFSCKFIELAGEINNNMPYFVMQKIMLVLNRKQILINNSNILIIGVAYKKDISDYRSSPAIKLIDLLQNINVNVSYYDPYIPKIESIDGDDLLYSISEINKDILCTFDAVVITTDHSKLNYEEIVRYAPLIIDTRNATKSVNKQKNNVILL